MITEKSRDLKFIIIIPIVVLVLAFVFDNVLIYVQEIRVEKATEKVVTECLTTNVTDFHERVKSLYEKYAINTEQLDVEYNDGYLIIYNSHSYPSFVGKLIGMNSYRVQINVKGYLNGKEVVIKEVPIDGQS